MRISIFLLLAACGSEPKTDSGSPTGAPLSGLTSSGETTGTDGNPTHDEDLQKIWNKHCGVSCHTDGSTDGSLSLDDGYDKIVGQASVDVPTMNLVEPGDLDNSYLWRKLEGTHDDVGGAGGTMPRTGTLPGPKRDRIELSILNGAPR